MSNNNIVRSWKDPKYRASLGPAALEGMPANPAGSIEVSDTKLKSAGGNTRQLTTAWFCTMYSVGGSRCCN
jgi:mersacidin/lichenicidin family type 2 lantibiotic